MHSIRPYFPFIAAEKVTWLDNAATTQKPEILFETEQEIYATTNANIHRGLYQSSEEITALYERARATVARWINSYTDELIFTSGTTAGLNMVATYWGPYFVHPGDEILVTVAEHHANFLPWQRLAQQVGATIRVIQYDSIARRFSIDASLLTEKTRLVAVTHYSNVLGPVWDEDADELCAFLAKAQSLGAFVVLDGAQSVAHKKVDVATFPVDVVAFSAHKVAGPTGVGALFLRKKWHDLLPPLFVGGGMVHHASVEESSWLKGPAKFEAGTPAIVQAISWAAALEFLEQVITKDVVVEMQRLMVYLIEQLEAIPGLMIMGNSVWIKKYGSLVSFSIAGVHAHDLAAYLAGEKIAVRAGHHCAQPLHQALQIASSLRISLYYYTTQVDIDRVVTALQKALSVLR